jgi:microcystin-dependent protein
MTVSVPNTFVNGTAADADQVNQNFDALVGYVNTQVPLLTGERSYTGSPDFANFKALRVGTPTEPTDGANKLYADSVIPVGVIQMFAGADNKIPLQWVKCNGQALSRSTYSDLFNAIGTAYGSGDGVNTFNVPNFTGSAAPGTPNADGVLRFPYPAAPGTRGGSHDSIVVSHSHTVPAHSHTGPSHTHSTPAHTHTVNARVGYQSGWSLPAGTQAINRGIEAGATPNNLSTVSGGGGTTGSGGTGATSTQPQVSTGASGASGTGANIPAYLGVNFIIRTGV